MHSGLRHMMTGCDCASHPMRMPERAVKGPNPMESKTARITVLIDPGKKLALEKLCAELDVTPSQVVRRLIRDYLADNGVPVAVKPAGQPGQRA